MYKLLLCCCACLALTAYAQVPAADVYRFIKTNSVYRNTTDWHKVDTAFAARLQRARATADTVRALLYVFEQMNDVHSTIISNGQSVANYPAYDDSTRARIWPLVQLSQQNNGVIASRLLQNKYAYLRVPGIMAWGREQVNGYAQALSDSLCNFSNKNIEGCIIDLRLNGGGQLASMVAGLARLLGDGQPGGGVDADGKTTTEFQLKDGNFFVDDAQLTHISHKCNSNFEKMPVVVLIGPATISSGSITAVVFKQRPRTFFIGEATADGYTTSNNYFKFNDHFALNLAINFVQDRKGIVYKTAVFPDQLVRGGDDFADFGKDAKVQAALRWLQQNK